MLVVRMGFPGLFLPSLVLGSPRVVSTLFWVVRGTFFFLGVRRSYVSTSTVVVPE